MSSNTASVWDSNSRILSTHLTGNITLTDVAVWTQGLENEALKIPDNSSYALLVNLVGFEPVSLDAHKAMRDVIPLFLTRYNFRTGFFDLVQAPDIPLTKTRGIECIAHANVHHDKSKMDTYNEKIGSEKERFLTNIDEAKIWLKSKIS
jgi:hypothetical protein